MKHLFLTLALFASFALSACDNKDDNNNTNGNQTSTIDVPTIAPASGTAGATSDAAIGDGGAMSNTPVPADTPSMVNTPAPSIAVGEPNPSAPGSTCGADQSWIGKNIKDVDLTQIKTPVRTMYPDSAATMDYSESRLNIIIEHGTDNILEVKCG